MSKAYRGFKVINIKTVLFKNGIAFKDAKKNKNFDAIVAGCELGYIRESDVLYMLDEKTSQDQATNRLIQRRREFFDD